MSEKAPRLLHPFLFAIAPIFFLFSHNIDELSLFDQRTLVRLVLPCVLSLGLSWALLLSLDRFVIKDRWRTGVLVSLLLFLFFGFGHAQNLYLRLVEHLGGDLRHVLPGLKLGHYKLFFALWTAGGLGATWLIDHRLRRHRASVPALTAYLNHVAAILVIMATIGIGWTEIQSTLHSPGKMASEQVQASPIQGITRGRPDIYYIILDAYAAADTLRDSFGFDNREFLDYLTGKGFCLAAKSCCNYNSTVLSLASSLNFEHLDHLRDKLGRETANLSLPLRMVENSRIMRFLKANGYAFINFKTPTGPASRNRNADWDVDCNRGLVADDFLRILVETTLLEPFFRIYNADSRRERILCQMASLPGVRGKFSDRRPIFVIAHILCPHYPYIFGRDGQAVSDAASHQTPKKKLYVDQLAFVNKLVMTMLDRLLADPYYRPLIILQGDHGPMDMPAGRTEEETIHNRTRILNAYLLPDGGAAGLYASISPVNTFRVILNHYFGTAYPLLVDRTFYAKSNYKTVFDFQEVTAIARYPQ